MARRADHRKAWLKQVKYRKEDTCGQELYKWMLRWKRHWRQKYRGVPCVKCIGDLWNYQELFHSKNFDYVFETGSKYGGSAYYYRDLFKTFGKDPYKRVVTVDVVDHLRIPQEVRDDIEFVHADSCSQKAFNKVKEAIPFDDPDRGPIFVSFDSAHTYDIQLAELELYVPLLRAGDFVVVEDTSLYGSAPLKAVNDFRKTNSQLEPCESWEIKFYGFSCAIGGYFNVV